MQSKFRPGDRVTSPNYKGREFVVSDIEYYDQIGNWIYRVKDYGGDSTGFIYVDQNNLELAPESKSEVRNLEQAILMLKEHTRDVLRELSSNDRFKFLGEISRFMSEQKQNIGRWDEDNMPRPKHSEDTMNIDELIKFADLLDSRGEYEAANEADKAIEDAMKTPESTKEVLHPMNNVFEKLTDIADSLDESGATKEANMIDSFISKYADDDLETLEEQPKEDQLPPLSERALREIDEGTPMIESKPNVEEEVSNFMQSPNMENYEKVIGLLEEHLRQSMSEEEMTREEVIAFKTNLIKKLADDVVNWKEEDDSDQKKRYDSKYHHGLLVREPKRDQERVDREGRKEHHSATYKPHEGSLQTRYCPDHLGDMMGRVGHGSFQCPRDGQVYNFETGYTNFDGVNVPGGSIAGQTPDSTGYGIPHRIFDSRDKAMNVIN